MTPKIIPQFSVMLWLATLFALFVALGPPVALGSSILAVLR